MFDGLYSYEVVLLCAGLILFIVLLWAFIVQVRSKSLGASLVMFFVIDIAMVGFPSIKEVQYKDGVITLEKTTNDLQDQPNDKALRTDLEDELQAILPRTLLGVKNANSLVKVAAAQYALGKESNAKANLTSALAANPSAPAALALKQKVDTIDRIQRLTSDAKDNEGNDNTSADLRAAIKQARMMNLANPKAIQTVEEAKKVLEDLNKPPASNGVDHYHMDSSADTTGSKSSSTDKSLEDTTVTRSPDEGIKQFV